jgi:hypothetical protein
MRRLNIVVSDEAGAVLDEHRDRRGLKSLDNAMDDLLLSLKEEKAMA